MNYLDVSVIIPIYNKEKYIEKCINSILSQSYDQEKIEIICINDGSTDRSLKIINRLKNKIQNLIIINKRNEGVSAARNCGISNSQGKYILFLDADDYISNNTIEDIVNYFDKVYDEIDIMTYNIYYLKNNKLKKGKRGKNLTQNCVIDVEKEFDFSQTTMNICIKNNKKIRFDEDLKICEDQLFNTNCIAKKGKIGWCNTAKYIYNRSGSGTSIINHPYYSYKSLIYFFNKLLELGLKYKKIENYCKSLILYNFDWRIKGDFFYPYHINNGKEVIDIEMQQILDVIDNRLILKNRWLLNDHKFFLMSNKLYNKPFNVYEDNCISLCDNNGELYRENSFTLCIEREKICGNKYKIMGFLKNATINFGEKPKLFIKQNNITKEIYLYNSTNSRFCSNIKTNNYYGMEIIIELFDGLKISFYAKINDNKYQVNLWFRPYSSISSENKVNYHFAEKFSIERKGQTLNCYNSNNIYINKKYKEHLQNIRKNYLGKYIIHGISKFLKRHTKIWLYNDARNYFDNSFIQFKHDIKKNDGILKFYIYKGSKDELYKKLSFFERFFCIKERTFLHRILFIASDKIYTSFFEKNMYVPYEKSFQFYCDIINFECIYLQHGVMHANLQHMYSKDVSFFIDKIVVSTFFEKDIAIKKLNFKLGDIIDSGAPRYSILNRKNINKKIKNRIIYVPSWRKYLLDHIGQDMWTKKRLYNHDFINDINNFLTNKELISFLEKNNLYLDIKLHRNFNEYKNDLICLSRKILIKNEIEISDYTLCISDISSIIFDFVFFNVPIIKYIPDIEMIKAGLHSYREFNYNLCEVGECVFTIEQLIKSIKKVFSTNFKPNYDRDMIFLPNISNSTETIYKIMS